MAILVTRQRCSDNNGWSVSGEAAFRAHAAGAVGLSFQNSQPSLGGTYPIHRTRVVEVQGAESECLVRAEKYLEECLEQSGAMGT